MLRLMVSEVQNQVIGKIRSCSCPTAGRDGTPPTNAIRVTQSPMSREMMWSLSQMCGSNEAVDSSALVA